MKRDIRLHGLTSDHHHALVLARRIIEAAARGDVNVGLVSEARRRCDEELSPHFAIEEEELLPALARAGREDLVDRTCAEHRALRAHLAAAEAGDAGRLLEFGNLLEAHVRFEERELFTACEALVEDDVLARVAQRAPKEKGVPPEWSRLLGADRTAQLQRVVRRTGLPPEALLDLAIDLLELASSTLLTSPIHRTAVALGAARWRNVSAEARSEALRRAAQARWAKRRAAAGTESARAGGAVDDE
jgi:hemerythrin-like domain-containing protein